MKAYKVIKIVFCCVICLYALLFFLGIPLSFVGEEDFICSPSAYHASLLFRPFFAPVPKLSRVLPIIIPALVVAAGASLLWEDAVLPSLLALYCIHDAAFAVFAAFGNTFLGLYGKITTYAVPVFAPLLILSLLVVYGCYTVKKRRSQEGKETSPSRKKSRRIVLGVLYGILAVITVPLIVWEVSGHIHNKAGIIRYANSNRTEMERMQKTIEAEGESVRIYDSLGLFSPVRGAWRVWDGRNKGSDRGTIYEFGDDFWLSGKARSWGVYHYDGEAPSSECGMDFYVNDAHISELEQGVFIIENGGKESVTLEHLGGSWYYYFVNQ